MTSCRLWWVSLLFTVGDQFDICALTYCLAGGILVGGSSGIF